MSESLWAASAEELLAMTASPDPTPGGGSIAAVCGALGVGLVQMAVAVTADPALDDRAARLAAVRAAVEPAADGDVQDFTALMSAYRLPRSSDAERAARAQAIEAASIAATERPLALVATLVDAIALSRELEPLVKASIRSDVLAGRDLVIGAARAAVRTADINLDQLDRLASPAAAGLRTRRDALVASLQKTSPEETP
ncbi:cyclodeaminase/cyclohydrolase family protein [Gryllotalpicola ginsengisoli]|uniref:cyclodeaminase/cyclohydrolase family protein n=1 Tax=Gryllotalpicola ginsengisoli TaxID=444608 RepID=UPI0003B4B7D1|nr:cyclodeaminase/cyclohydrolase family protein [Gryllotalpicola ginsengisoli]